MYKYLNVTRTFTDKKGIILATQKSTPQRNFYNSIAFNFFRFWGDSTLIMKSC